MPDRREAEIIRISENAKALLRRLGWTDEQLAAVLRKPERPARPEALG